MKTHYEPEFKKKLVRLHLEEGRTLTSLVEEYRVSRASITNWIKQYREECQVNPKSQEDYDSMKENLRLRKELAELQKENNFLKKALNSQPTIKDGLVLHSDQGSQYSSKAFTEYCESVKIKQSMRKAGCPYDNSPMERYFNTFKNELIYMHHYHNGLELMTDIEDFAYTWYNHVRPHTFNNYKTPHEARCA